MELVLILVPIFVFVLLKMILDQRAAARADHVRLLEEALKNPNIDRPTLESLTYQLTGNRAPRNGGPGGIGGAFQAVILAVGWLVLFTGIGVWVGGEMCHDHDMNLGGIVTSIIGFGLVTFPFALRELEARRQPQ
ncbi:MAG: hypothetical protein JNK15_07825 [Planctomycetes bacterium]|nr:hypothetical protein [Planctomycetota bacterium]